MKEGKERLAWQHILKSLMGEQPGWEKTPMIVGNIGSLSPATDTACSGVSP